MKLYTLILFLAFLLGTTSAEQCGHQAGGALCPNGLCCGEYGWCGTTTAYCGNGCQSQCAATPPSPPSAEQCGHQAGGALCPNGLCCGEYGWCGTTAAYCGNGCQSQCAATPPPPPPNPTQSPPPPPQPDPVPPPGDGVATIISATLFDQLLKYRNDPRCRSNGFYTYNAFIAAANSFAGFGTTGDADTRKREIAAFLGQTSHETTGGWEAAPDGPYAWGYCFIDENDPPEDYCSQARNGRVRLANNILAGALFNSLKTLTVNFDEFDCLVDFVSNYNYGQAGQALGLGLNLLNNPDLVAEDAILSFKTAIWFWMTPQGNKPSSHDVIIGKWTPTAADTAAGRVPGYGVITNIINGGVECGHGPDSHVEDRIGFYVWYCDEFGVSYGDNLDCNNQRPFA